MAVDTSAVFAILTKEHDSAPLRSTLEDAVQARMSTGTYVELSIVCLRRAGHRAVGEMDAFLRSADIRLVPFDAEQADLAAEAYRTYGKGRHAAGLNFGDCFAYALAKALDAPLLFKGADFTATDIRAAVA
ncbi:hypothetical protein CKO28_04085 [Rhodovibrio sodomensis]|uniref:Ribonuclease VapC n=1 Tax=Rhodovibrio sodomensis TaxID=1088 RepID=A0ABS1DBC5_9PROT|nr:hypothetical protein [Rhodovibrio sodomensis]